VFEKCRRSACFARSSRSRLYARRNDGGHKLSVLIHRPAGDAPVGLVEAVDLARKFCAAEPSTVLVGVETTKREWAEKARTPGDEYMVPLLNEYRAAWALIRQWTGHDPAIAAREETIQKLERLVWDAIYARKKAGLDREAARLRRAIQRD
jgi:hypothetical protein